LLLDLDNTLLDREAAFRAWASAFLDGVGAPEDLEWLIDSDRDGLTSRWELADVIRDRYALDATVVEIVDALHDGVVLHTRLDPLVACAVEIAGNAGWVPVVVSNGATRQQDNKIRKTGLDRYLVDWVISEEAGVSKPDPRIFSLAADRARMSLRGAWVIGDSPEADIGGAAALGLNSVWLHRGRRWTEPRYKPTMTANGPIEAVAAMLERATARPSGPAGPSGPPGPSRPDPQTRPEPQMRPDPQMRPNRGEPPMRGGAMRPEPPSRPGPPPPSRPGPPPRGRSYQ
jgi:putative hydrolase of the HAD superfamily